VRHAKLSLARRGPSTHESPRVHNLSRRRGGCVAACGASAAAGEDASYQPTNGTRRKPLRLSLGSNLRGSRCATRFGACPIQDQRTRHLIGQPRQGRRSGSKPHDTPRDPSGPEAECECRSHHQMTMATAHASGASGKAAAQLDLSTRTTGSFAACARTGSPLIVLRSTSMPAGALSYGVPRRLLRTVATPARYSGVGTEYI
jgi:hypothetical protein